MGATFVCGLSYFGFKFFPVVQLGDEGKCWKRVLYPMHKSIHTQKVEPVNLIRIGITHLWLHHHKIHTCTRTHQTSFLPVGGAVLPASTERKQEREWEYSKTLKEELNFSLSHRNMIRYWMRLKVHLIRYPTSNGSWCFRGRLFAVLL